MEHFKKIAKWNEVVIASAAEQHAFDTATRQAEELKIEIDVTVKAARQILESALKPGEKLPEPVESKFPQATRSDLKLCVRITRPLLQQSLNYLLQWS